MRTIKLVLEYDGTDFAGWQFQTNGRSVQGVLEAALSSLLQEPIRVTGSGRTDAGVHARGQVCHFSTGNAMEARSLCRGVNAVLPDDVVARWAEDVAQDFHARYSARLRSYRYHISQTPVAMFRRYRWFVGQQLDIEAMRRCANALIGERDFQAFCKADTAVKHFRCTVTTAEWSKDNEDLVFLISANRFLYGMVRALVGTMVDVGRGHITEKVFLEVMSSKDRTRASSSAPASGLVLESVYYDEGT